jgi:NAD(P)H-dependent flavin oxidoreductase YrpB (nitropropane dioxygenase family)
MKFSVPLVDLDSGQLANFAAICGWALARAHAKGGDAGFLSGYLGRTDAFDQALGKFAIDYADQTERDHAALVKAVKSGRVQAVTQ